MPDPIPAFQAIRLSLIFIEREDRLLLLAFNREGAQEAVVLTRRLTARLINGLASVLEQSNVAASTAPQEFKDDIVLIEHQGALAAAESTHGNAGAKPQAQVRPDAGATGRIPQRLVHSVNIKINPREFQIVLQPEAGLPVATTMNRLDLHRLVEALKRQAETAGWNLPIDAAWLGDDHSQFSIN